MADDFARRMTTVVRVPIDDEDPGLNQQIVRGVRERAELLYLDARRRGLASPIIMAASLELAEGMPGGLAERASAEQLELLREFNQGSGRDGWIPVCLVACTREEAEANLNMDRETAAAFSHAMADLDPGYVPLTVGSKFGVLVTVIEAPEAS